MADYSDRVEHIIQGAALGALQEAAETVLVMFFQDWSSVMSMQSA